MKAPTVFDNSKHHRVVYFAEEGYCEKFTCPYHGWTYLLDGRLERATRLKGIEDFSAKNFGLIPIRQCPSIFFTSFIWKLCDRQCNKEQPGSTQVHFPSFVIRLLRAFGSCRTQSLGPLVFIYLGRDEPPALESEFKAATDVIDRAGFYSGLTFVKTLSYKINCNWKVFVDNYLDGTEVPQRP